MINTATLEQIVNEYNRECRRSDREPSYIGLGTALGISGQTIRHIVRGLYKEDKPYTNKPHPTRCIDNQDFNIIRALFKEQ